MFVMTSTRCRAALAMGCKRPAAESARKRPSVAKAPASRRRRTPNLLTARASGSFIAFILGRFIEPVTLGGVGSRPGTVDLVGDGFHDLVHRCAGERDFTRDIADQDAEGDRRSSGRRQN